MAALAATAKAVGRLFDEESDRIKPRLVAIYVVLGALQLGAWAWALMVFADKAALLDIAVLSYVLGLRHAVDADHIAAIDNVTRKLMQERKKPVLVGFYFALGHSTVITIVTLVVAYATAMLGTFREFQQIGGTLSTAISAPFLIAIGAMNVVVFVSLLRSYRRLCAGGGLEEGELDLLLGGGGVMARVFRRLFRLIDKSWHMFPLGFLFGLGFDTATEVALFGVTAAQAAQGVSLASVLVFPLLFVAGMSLLDTTDGALMLGAYQWAFINPMRKLIYSMTITLVSVFVALLIGAVELLGMCGDRLALTGGLWTAVASLQERFNTLGMTIIGLFLAAWMVSFLVYRLNDPGRGEPAR